MIWMSRGTPYLANTCGFKEFRIFSLFTTTIHMKQILSLLTLGVLFAAASVSQALTINPIYSFTDPSGNFGGTSGLQYGVAGDVNTAGIPSYEAAVNAAIAVIQSHISDNITLNITCLDFNAPGYGGGYSQAGQVAIALGTTATGDWSTFSPTYGLTNVSTSQWLSYLHSGPTNAAVNAEIASVTAMSNSVSSVAISPILMQKMGVNTNITISAAIAINPSIENASRTTNLVQNWYDMQTIVEHQLMAVLGAADFSSVVGQGGASNTYGALDFLRYSSNGVHSFTTGALTNSTYFSINGGQTAIANFSPTNSWSSGGSGNGYDTPCPIDPIASGDWATGANIVGSISPSYIMNGGAVDLSTADLTSLQAIGYQVTYAVPEPSTYIMFGLGGLAAVVSLGRKRIHRRS